MTSHESGTGGQSASARSSNPARPLALVIIAMLVGVAGWYALSDRHAPSTSRAVISANVVQIAPRVSGRVTGIMVSDNEVVPAGDVLFRIDDRPFALAVEQARAQLDLAAQSIDASSAQLSATYAQVAQARANLENATSENARIEELSDRGLVPSAQLGRLTDAARECRSRPGGRGGSIQERRGQSGRHRGRQPADQGGSARARAGRIRSALHQCRRATARCRHQPAAGARPVRRRRSARPDLHRGRGCLDHGRTAGKSAGRD